MYSDVNDVLEFLSELYHTEKAGYSVINQARSALSSFLTLSSFSVGNHPLICRFVKGVFNLRPPAPRCKEIRDVGPVFNYMYLRCMSPANSLSLKRLTLKLPLLNLSADMVYLWCYIGVGLFQKLVYTKSALHV